MGGYLNSPEGPNLEQLIPEVKASASKNGPQLKAMARSISSLAEWTGLEPATPGVTGRYSNQLNYHS
jgi:hypothetical protein